MGANVTVLLVAIATLGLGVKASAVAVSVAAVWCTAMGKGLGAGEGDCATGRYFSMCEDNGSMPVASSMATIRAMSDMAKMASGLILVARLCLRRWRDTSIHSSASTFSSAMRENFLSLRYYRTWPSAAGFLSQRASFRVGDLDAICACGGAASPTVARTLQ